MTQTDYQAARAFNHKRIARKNGNAAKQEMRNARIEYRKGNMCR